MEPITPIASCNCMGANFIKYDALSRLTIEAFGNTRFANSSEVNVYIDMASAISFIYHDNSKLNHPYEIAATMVNLAAHMRDFFLSRHGVYANVFIVYSRNLPDNCTALYPDYNSSTRDRYIKHPEMLKSAEENVNFLSIFCPYLPNVYMLAGEFEVSTIILNSVCRQSAKSPSIPSIVLTRDILTFQLPAIKDDIFIYRPSRNIVTREDTSFVVNNRNALVELVRNREIESKKPDPLSVQSSSVNIANLTKLPSLSTSIFMALSSLPARNIKMMLNVPCAINVLAKAYFEDQTLPIGYVQNMDIVYDSLRLMDRHIPTGALNIRFKLVDSIYQHSLMLEHLKITSDAYDMCVVNKYDPESVRALNDRYFSTCPINLNKL